MDTVPTQRLAVELGADQAVGPEEELREREGDGILEVPALQLKVVLGKVHPLLPHHSCEGLHDRTC